MENRQRNKKITIWIDEGKRLKWRTKVKKSGLSQTLFFEKIVDDITVVNVRQFSMIMKELKYQGNNLNQLAKKINSGERIWHMEVVDELERNRQVYEETIKAITDAMSGKNTDCK